MEERTDRDSVGAPGEQERPTSDDLDRIVPEVTSANADAAPTGAQETPAPDESSPVSEPEPPESQGAAEATEPAEATGAQPAQHEPLQPEGEPQESAGEAAELAAETQEPEAEASDGSETEGDATVGEAAEEKGDDETEVLPRLDTVAAAAGDDTPAAPVAKGRVPWWPFIVYLVAWIALIGTAFYLISYEPEALPAFQQEEYPYILLGGLVLTVAGPLLALIVWLITWLRSDKDKRGGLLTSALLKGALVTCFGVLAWWGAIAVLDALRLGMIGPIS